MIERVNNSTTGSRAWQENTHHNLECIGSQISKEEKHAYDDNHHLY